MNENNEQNENGPPITAAPNTPSNSVGSFDPLVETSNGRSLRLRVRNDGFKQDNCTKKDCFACSTSPPGLSIKAIKKIGEPACMIAPMTFFNDTLRSKLKTGKTIGEKKTSKKTTSSKTTSSKLEMRKTKKADQDHDEPSKKSKN
ncbi:hypothetical protein SETIT_5G189600v2 [Setaria italica]|uniref:Uncharacterized protein n=1 Tax=Setaria italica TaxID=4555 RepID=A0A368R6Q4_SETIT|nr:hypothetical protein SETIT_5G189600v2 [Setaria italica]